MTILVTGGTGYIGSHACVELIDAGYDVIAIDNLSNSKMAAVTRIETITGKKLKFHIIDLLDECSLEHIFTNNRITAVIHFAGFKAVGESVEKPLQYFHNNLSGTINLCRLMVRNNVKKLVFSSSATVYGIPGSVPIHEDSPTGATNPYGRTKLIIEDMLKDLYASDKTWSIVLLRYFNPIGAHESGLIGEDPGGIPNNLMPYITQVAVGKLKKLRVFGNDYNTSDGTGVRDYIHVVDLVRGHLKALESINRFGGIQTYNLGTGKGCTVLELVYTFQEVTGIPIPYEVIDRRPGDIDTCYADPRLAEKRLGWKAEKNIADMCRDSWFWQQKNPHGFNGAENQ